MRKTVTLIMAFSIITSTFSQDLRLTVHTGLANYCGDIQQKVFTLQKARPVVGIGVQYNFNNKVSVRSEYSFSSLSADDKNNKRIDLKERNLNFTTKVREANLLGEYNFLDINDYKFTPYVFAGVATFHFNPYTHTAEGEKIYLRELSTEGQGLKEYPERKEYSKTEISIPYGGGIKYAISDKVYIGAELGLRKLFTDYVDDVSRTYVDGNALLEERGQLARQYSYRGDELNTSTEGYPGYGYIRGDPKQNDSYYFAQLRLIVKMNWSGRTSYESPLVKRRNRTGCPSNVL